MYLLWKRMFKMPTTYKESDIKLKGSFWNNWKASRLAANSTSCVNPGWKIAELLQSPAEFFQATTAYWVFPEPSMKTVFAPGRDCNNVRKWGYRERSFKHCKSLLFGKELTTLPERSVREVCEDNDSWKIFWKASAGKRMWIWEDLPHLGFGIIFVLWKQV